MYAPHKYSLGCEVAQETNPRVVNVVERNPKQCLTFTGRVAKYETEIIVDSGSGISIISFDLFSLINKYARSPLDISSKAGFIRRIIVASNRIQFKSTEIVIKCDHYATWL